MLQSAADLLLMNATNGAVVATLLEPAFDSATRNRGLLGRDGMPDGAALVIAPSSSVHTFFMRFPIDVVFAAKDGRVVKVCNAVPPWRIAFGWRAFAAIELPSGTAARAGVNRGDYLVIKHLQHAVSEEQR
jgi:uncharacterized protein